MAVPHRRLKQLKHFLQPPDTKPKHPISTVLHQTKS